MFRYLSVGLLLFTGFAIFFAPAGLVNRAFDSNAELFLLNPQGTLWSGDGQLIVNQVSAGSLTWAFKPQTLLQANIGLELTLRHPLWHAQASIKRGFSSVETLATGRIDAKQVSAFLARYNIFTQGDLTLERAKLITNSNLSTISELQGQIKWNGGPIRYILSGTTQDVVLPELFAQLSINKNGDPQAMVFTKKQQEPLLIATLTADGFAKVALTKQFTKILNNPWPGSDPDHAIVIEVEEKLY